MSQQTQIDAERHCRGHGASDEGTAASADQLCKGPCRCGREACYLRSHVVASVQIYYADRADPCAVAQDRLAANNPHRLDYPHQANAYRQQAKELRKTAAGLMSLRSSP